MNTQKKRTSIIIIYFLISLISITFLALFQLKVNAAEGDTVTQDVWDGFEPELEELPSTIKATKKLELTTNAPDGVEVSYEVSNEKKAEIINDNIFVGKMVGKVTITATFTATLNGAEVTKEISEKIKIKGKKKIYLDPGHQSIVDLKMEPVGPGSSKTSYRNTVGCQGVATKIPEYKFTLTIAKKMKKALEAKGYEVLMSRTKHNVNISNVERSLIWNKTKSDIVIRIHADSFTDPNMTGASLLYPSESNPYPIKNKAKQSKKLANKMINSYCKATGIKNRGIIVRNDLTGFNWSTLPTVLIECGFMSNAAEDRLINSADMQEKMVTGMVNGIDSYFGYK